MKIKSHGLAVCILNELRKKGFRTSSFDFNSDFKIEELDSITELNITNTDSLEGIENLKNLKTLRLLSANLDSFSHVKALNNIADFSCLKNLKNLENLVIWHDNNIKVLDVRNLNLKNLTLISNQNLTQLKGLDSIKTLENIYVVGSNITDIGSPSKYLEATKNAKENVLDLRAFEMFHEKKLGFKLTGRESNIRFAEGVHFFDEVYIYSLEQMRELNRIGSNLISIMDLKNRDNYRASFEIYKYIIRTVKYDYKGLAYREENFKVSDKKDKDYMRMIFINTSLSALKSQRAVCDGYVNAIIYLLSLINIKALPVICQNKDGSLHTAIKILINNEWIYADPEKDSHDAKIRYFNLTRDELAKIYTIAPNEYLDHLDGGSYVKRFS